MSFEKLLAQGADLVAGTVYLHRKEVGKFVHGTFVLYPEGEAILAELEEAPQQVEIPDDKPKKAKAEKKAKATPEPAASEDPLEGLDLP
jgi:hypothetical protein